MKKTIALLLVFLALPGFAIGADFKISDKANIAKGSMNSAYELLLDTGSDYNALTLAVLLDWLDEQNWTLTGTINATGATATYPCVTASDCSTYSTAGMCCVDSDDWKMYLGTGSGVAYVGYDASGLNSGTVSTNRYSAYADLVAESKIAEDSTIITSESEGDISLKLGDHAGTYSFSILGDDDSVAFSIASNGVMGGISSFVPPYTASAPTAYQLQWDTDFLTSRAALCGHDNTAAICFSGSATAPSADGQFLIFDNDAKAFTPYAMSGHATMTDAGVVTVTDFALGADADAGDYDITSIDKLEGYDSAIYIDMGADGYLDLEADTAIRFNGPVTLANEGQITAGGIVLGDSTPDADGEIGYASNAYKLFANSEDLVATASANLWTFSSGTSAVIDFSMAITANTVTTDAADDPAIYFDPLTAGESEWWIGTNNNNGGTDDDNFEIRQSATPGTNVEFKVEPDGDITSTGDLTVTGADITLAAAGVKLTGSNGSLTILGLGDGQDEDVKIDLNTTANTIEITSPASSATAIDINTLNLVTTGTIQGAIKISSDADGMTQGEMTAVGMYGSMFFATGAGTWNLPAAAAGMSFCLYSTTQAAVIINPDDADVLVYDGVADTAGHQIAAPNAAAGEFICFVALDAEKWYALGKNGTWVPGS